MNYVYEMNLWSLDRTVRAIYVEEESNRTYDFQPVTFTEEDLMAETVFTFNTSRLETLVCLFTGQDPARMVQDADTRCKHDEKSSCDCPPVSIPLPTELALHAHTLSNEVAEIRYDFQKWENGVHLVRGYHDRDGNREVVRRPAQGYEGGEHSTEKAWRKAVFLEKTALRKTLDRWFEQGIALHRGSLEQRHTTQHSPSGEKPTP